MTTPAKSVLIVGASRGLGYALAERYLERGCRVVATARAGSRATLDGLAERSKGALEIELLDINAPDEITALRKRLGARAFDLLWINAGVNNDDEETVAGVSTGEFVRLMVTNALSPLRAIEVLKDIVPPEGTIAVMSSRQGSIAANSSGGHEIYRASKSALNSLMRSFAARNADDPRTLLLMAPGWIKTDLGGSDAPFTVDEQIPKVIDVVEAQRGTSGLQFLNYDGSAVPW